jgi:hypothetical protein
VKRKRVTAVVPAVPVASPVAEASHSALKKQDRYGGKPWQPGEIPTRAGAFLPITGPLDAKSSPYGEFMAVERPTNRGQGYSPIALVDIESHETKHKQTSGAHGVRKL